MTSNVDTKSELAKMDAAVENSQAPKTLKVAELDGSTAMAVQEPGAIVPIKPSFIDIDSDSIIINESNAILEMVKSDSTNPRLMEIPYKLGDEAMDLTNIQLGLYETKMGLVLNDVTSESPVMNNILELKQNLELTNPMIVGKKKYDFGEKTGWLFKKVVMRLPKGPELLDIIAKNHTTVSDVSKRISEELNKQGEVITRDASELKIIADSLKEAQLPLQRDIYLGQVVIKIVTEYFNRMDSGPGKDNVGMFLSDLSSAVVGMQQLDNLNLSTRYGASLLIRNSWNVRSVIRSTALMTGSVTAALGVQAAAQRQVQVQNMNAIIQDTVISTHEDTVKKTMQAITQSAEMNQEQVKKVERLIKINEDFDQASIKLANVCTETIKIGSMVSNELNEANSKLRERTEAAHQAAS